MRTHEATHYVAVLAFLATIGLGGCARSTEASAKSSEKAVPSVAVAKIARQDLARELELAAEFRPYKEIDVHAKVSGYLREIYVDVGDRVSKGQLLAVLEVPEMAQELIQADAVTKRNTLDVERIRGEVFRAESALKIRKLSYDRLAGVLKARPNLIAQQEIDDAAARLSEAEAQLAAAKANLAATQQQVSVALAGKERIDTMLQYLRISAPFAGVITQRKGDPGALVQAGTTSSTQAMAVVRLSQIDRLRLVLPVPESIVPRIRTGSPVEVRVDSLKRVFQGRVSRFTGRLDAATRTMETEVDIPNRGYELMPGMYGYATLKLDRRDDAIGAPVQAVSGQGENATVMVVKDGEIEVRHIETGIETPTMIEVLSGLSEDEFVVVGGRSRLKAGMAVEAKLIEQPAAGRSH